MLHRYWITIVFLLKKVKNIAISLAQEGESIERIARILGETEKTIKEWLAETH
mgnify:CR=1 FL=1